MGTPVTGGISEEEDDEGAEKLGLGLAGGSAKETAGVGRGLLDSRGEVGADGGVTDARMGTDEAEEEDADASAATGTTTAATIAGGGGVDACTLTGAMRADTDGESGAEGAVGADEALPLLAIDDKGDEDPALDAGGPVVVLGVGNELVEARNCPDPVGRTNAEVDRALRGVRCDSGAPSKSSAKSADSSAGASAGASSSVLLYRKDSSPSS